ncbi:MAG: ROK family protein [Chthoniobacterales bacterium]|nr:ROK family protein [Chthoniobacterales bacterium]
MKKKQNLFSILVIDVGGTHVKVKITGRKEERKFPSGPTMTPQMMVDGVKDLTRDWHYDVISIGFPAVISKNSRLLKEPANLGKGWVGFNFNAAFGCPIKVINDAAMQALGDYAGGRVLFLGLGTGLGTTMIDHGNIIPMELGHFPYKKGTIEDYTGRHALEKLGKKKWRKHVFKIIELLQQALEPEKVILGGGDNVYLKKLPPGVSAAANSNAFLGGFLLWKHTLANHFFLHNSLFSKKK